MAKHSLAAYVLLLLATAVSARADSISIVSGSYGFSGADDTSIDGNASQQITPTNPLPFQNTQTVVDSAASNITSYDFSNNALIVNMTQSRPGTLNSFSESYGNIYFTIQPDIVGETVTYTLSGSYSVHDSGNSPGYVYFRSYLYDQTVFSDLVDNIQQSSNSIDESFSLGQTAGDSGNYSTGAFSGTLLAGHQYLFSYVAYIEAYPDSDSDSGAAATGNITLAFSDSSSVAAAAAPLPGVAGLGFCMLAGYGLVEGSRRRKSRVPA